MVVDYHGFSTQGALAATMMILDDVVEQYRRDPSKVRHLVMVVGVGHRSLNGLAVLRQFLMDALPVAIKDVPSNPGRIWVHKEELTRFARCRLSQGNSSSASSNNSDNSSSSSSSSISSSGGGGYSGSAMTAVASVHQLVGTAVSM